MSQNSPSRYSSLTVIILAIFVMAALFAATWDMNYWPTDAEDYYIDAAAQLPALSFVSEMHHLVDQANTKWLHGKEMFIVLSSVFQGIYHDEKSLRPLVAVCIFSVGLSAILIFVLARNFWGLVAGWVAFILFLTSFWPYVYVLFVKHQPLGLFFFLLALFFLQMSEKGKIDRRIFHFLSGISLCFSVYSSTTSPLYFPYYVAGFFYVRRASKEAGKFFRRAAWILPGFGVTFFCFNYPDVATNVKSYLQYSAISKSFSHFYYNQPVLIQWMTHPELGVRGGWEWIVKYFFLMMPVLFPFYLLSLAYFLWRLGKTGILHTRFAIMAMVLLSFSSPFLAEVRGVAQYGANYFTSIVGIIMLVAYGLSCFLKSEWFEKINKKARRFIFGFLCLILFLHVAVNSYVFTTDLYPSRMATTFVSKKIAQLGLSEVNTYATHPHRRNMIDCLTPSLVRRLQFFGIKNIYQAASGYILVPPVTGESIYLDCTKNSYDDFDKDIFLNELLRKGTLRDYAVFSSPTLASSKIWRQEEEILSYRDLILNQFEKFDPQRGKVWLLDAEKLRKDFEKNTPSREYAELIFRGVRNIGTKTRLYMYEGEKKFIRAPGLLSSFVFKMYKVGEPADSLVAYVYKVGKEEPVWIPYGEGFASEPVRGESVTSGKEGQNVMFTFSKSFRLTPGPCRLVIYRTGKPDDRNFYRIYTNDEELIREGIKAATVIKK